MSDAAHTAAVPEKRARSRPSIRRRARTQTDAARHGVSFEELVRVHHLRQQALEAGEIYEGAAHERYREFLSTFERDNGKVVNSYWASSVASAVALTESRRTANQNVFCFHRVTDWATKDEPEIAAALHECDELAAKAVQVLRGKTLRVAMQLVIGSAAHLLSLVDAPSSHETKQKKDQALKLERQRLAQARAYYREAATGQAQVDYFGGMMLALVLVVVVAIVGWTKTTLPEIDDREFFGCLMAGALGAVVSVMSRIGNGRFRLSYEVGRQYPVFLGSLRPVVGGVFGLGLYFALVSGALNIFKLPDAGDTSRFYFFLVLAFVAGFSERWARDTLLSIGGGKLAGERKPEAKRTKRDAQTTTETETE